MRADGRGQPTNISNTNGATDTSPDWQPRP
jgi:hypothetical protein